MGKKGKQAVLPEDNSDANVQRADVQRADVQKADVQKADVQSVDVRKVALQKADVTYTADEPYAAEESYAAARELAESYADLLKLQDEYQSRLGDYPHYTLDDAYYLLTQGAHEQSERVQTSGVSDPVARAAENAEKLMNRLNHEMEEEYRKDTLKPYLDVCEKIELFNICMKTLDRDQRHIAEQLYVQKKPKKYVEDLNGTPIRWERLEKENADILKKFDHTISEYVRYTASGGKSLIKEDDYEREKK